MAKDKIIAWKLVATTECGDDIAIIDIPDDVSYVVDGFITEWESEGNV